MQDDKLPAVQAASVSLADAARPTRPGAHSRNTDLILADEDGDDSAPPAYGDIYDEIRGEEDGMGTTARITDDGRVDIRINQFSRRLSQVFSPALRQQIPSSQDSPPSPPVARPPPLNIFIQVVGSCGDVQPFVALGKVLKETHGHWVRLATHANFESFVRGNGLEFFDIGDDPSRLMAFMVKNPGLMPGFRSLASGDVSQQRRDVGEYIQGYWRSCYEAGDGMGRLAIDVHDLTGPPETDTRPFVADCIIANPPSFAHVHCAEKLGCPLHIMFTMPYSPTQGGIVARAGAGPEPIPIKQLTASRLADAITFCMKPESLENAKTLASKIAAERPGSEVGAELFHQCLESDRLRCTLTPSRTAVWRVKRSKIRLSALATCTLANVNMLEFDDLKLFRVQEYYTDEGPVDPISGGFTAACRAVSGMGLGIAEIPSETWKGLRDVAGPSRKTSQTPVAETSRGSLARPSSIRTTSRLGGTMQDSEDLAGTQSRPKLSKAPYSSSSSTPSSGSSALHRHFSAESSHTRRDQVRNRVENVPGKSRDAPQPTAAHTSQGIGRDIAVNLTRGSHNLPKLWGDDTEQVTDIKTGFIAVGRESGLLGWYDGVTGLVTQLWNGARKEGAARVAKGVSKGIVGFIAKPLAGTIGVLGHSMKGFHKEAQKAHRTNIQRYIVASRAAQGYEDWLLSSEAEKQDVIERWKRIKKHLKKRNHDEVLKDVLGAQHKATTER
ncbi:Sterol 3-beta-glucosyltransferase UGT80B1, partial [Fulvia fulva]